MITSDIKALMLKLNDCSSMALQNAIGMCVSRTHYEITVEHFLYKLLEDTESDCSIIVAKTGIDSARLQKLILQALEEHKSGNSAKPVFSPQLLDLIQYSWLISSIDLSERKIRSGAILIAYLTKIILYSSGYYSDLFKEIDRDALIKSFADYTVSSKENLNLDDSGAGTGASLNGVKTGGVDGFINQFCTDFTELAKTGKIDPVFGRDEELRLIIEILGRRRKNNPICVGEPGVGKTSIVEGLALRVVHDDVPDLLKGMRVLGLDMGALEAGAGVKGEFEKRLRGVINEIKSSTQKTILFIDEAHMLIGAGGAAGGNDAANLLKPSLARGELRTIAATTWKEYKKYFEKDPALVRRFQLVKLDEPSLSDATLILRGIKEHYEKEHQVTIRDAAVEAAVILSDRYITDRFLPDKAIDLLDTSCSRIKINLSAKPGLLDDKEREIDALKRNLTALERDRLNGISIDEEQYTNLLQDKELLEAEAKKIHERWLEEKRIAEEIINIRQELFASKEDKKKLEELSAKLRDAENRLIVIQQPEALIRIDVDEDVVAEVVSDWTGVPLGKMQRDESSILIDLEERLKESIKGQDHALHLVADSIRAAKSGLKNANQPIAVFLFVGPSGTGKTECSQALADLIFGNRKNIVTINMSEFQESHTASRLLGSPPGYVGYGEGGMLTEAVRQRPYSVVLLDEAEKAHLDVLNVFYQVFDKGIVNDGEGKEINFKNTIIILTSNLASDVIQEMTGDKGNGEIPLTNIISAINPVLSAYFKPALLARMTVVPFFSLDSKAMYGIVEQKLQNIKNTLFTNNKMVLTYSSQVVETIVSRCVEVESGARNIDFILNGNVLPKLSKTIIMHAGSGKMPEKVNIDVSGDGEFSFTFGGEFLAPVKKTRKKKAEGKKD